MAKPQPLKKERTNRQSDLKDHPFVPYNITPETAHTAVLLLLSKEPEILCQTLRSLTKFCSPVDSPNRSIIFDYDGIKYTLPHIEHPETNIKRFAMKLLAQLCRLPRGPEQVIQNPLNVRRIATSLATSQDLFILEFSSLALAKCTKEPVGCDQVISANILGVLLNHLKNCIDPDVQKNCLQVLINLLDDPVTSAEVTKSPQFSWPPLLALLQSPFPVIQQNILKTINYLVGRYNDVNIQKSFKASTGVLDLTDILESYEFRDIHTLALGTLKTFVETEGNAAHFYQSGCVQRLLDYLEMALPVMKSHVLSVLSKMSSTFNGRIALFETGTDLVFCHHLLSSTNEVLADSAMGVANMCKMWASAVRMADTNIVDAIASIIQDENAAWFDIKMNALLALSVLCRIVYKAACATVEAKNFNALRNVNRKAKETPVEAQRLAMQCYINLLNYHTSTKVMINGDFISELIGTLQKIDTQLKIQAATILAGLTTEDSAKNIFTNKKGEEAIAKNLTIEHVGLRTALCQLITASVTEDSADIYLGMGTIQYMIENKTARYKVSAWEPAIEAILRQHPSAKLAYTGRLEINDTATEGFYVMKRISETFQTLAEILDLPAPFVDPVLIAKFLPSSHEKQSIADIRSPWRSSQSRLTMESNPMHNFVLPDDSNLRSYLVQLKIWFGDPAKSLQYIEIEDAHYEVRYREKCQEVSTSLKTRAQVLGEYVVEQMSGLTQERDCSLPSVEMHLADLMLESRRRVIGLGYVKCGGALERAILYKVLADRVGIPCSLHRATSAHAWVEVAVPEIDPDEELEDERYPAGLLRENYIVDLMEKPGNLIPLSSHEARRICGPACTPLYVARAAPEICKCMPQEN